MQEIIWSLVNVHTPPSTPVGGFRVSLVRREYPRHRSRFATISSALEVAQSFQACTGRTRGEEAGKACGVVHIHVAASEGKQVHMGDWTAMLLEGRSKTLSFEVIVEEPQGTE